MKQKTLESFQKVRPVVIQKDAKVDPDMEAGMTPKQQERWLTAVKEGVSSYYLQLLRRAVTEGEITLGRFSEMLAMTPEQAMDFLRAMGMAK